MYTTFAAYCSGARQKAQNYFLPQASSEQEVNEKHREKTPPGSSQQPAAPQKTRNVSEKGEKIKKDLDKIMDEIDNVLEENAEEFIKSYVQRGGE